MSRTGPLTIEHADKVVHFAAYFLLAWLGSRQLSRTSRPQPILTLVVWAVIYAMYGAVDEWLQSFVNRTMSLADWLANVAGIVVATVLAGFLGRREP